MDCILCGSGTRMAHWIKKSRYRGILSVSNFTYIVFRVSPFQKVSGLASSFHHLTLSVAAPFSTLNANQRLNHTRTRIKFMTFGISAEKSCCTQRSCAVKRNMSCSRCFQLWDTESAMIQFQIKRENFQSYDVIEMQVHKFFILISDKSCSSVRDLWTWFIVLDRANSLTTSTYWTVTVCIHSHKPKYQNILSTSGTLTAAYFLLRPDRSNWCFSTLEIFLVNLKNDSHNFLHPALKLKAIL